MKNRRTLRKSILLALLVVAVGLSLGAVLMLTSPTTNPEEKIVPAKIVRTILVEPRTEKVTVTSYGPVIPARKVSIKPEVSGRIVNLHESLVPGGYLQADEELIRIDPADYKLDLAEQESALEEAEFELAVEEGRQVVAQRELKLLEEDLAESEVNKSLVLRQPHLRRTEAMVRAATNEIARAQLALSRTSLRAPFNAMVLSESVESGQLVEAGNEIATLVGTDEFWVQATLPVADLRRIRLPGPDEPGASAQVFLDTGNGEPVSWPGQVIRLLSDLEDRGRMARMVIRVEDPLRLKSDSDKLPLLLGSYVRVEIDAGTLKNVLVIPSVALRENQRIWVVDAENRLQIREAETLWRHQDQVMIVNVMNPGEHLVISGLRTALPGMKVEPHLENSDTSNGLPGEFSSIPNTKSIQATP